MAAHVMAASLIFLVVLCGLDRSDSYSSAERQRSGASAAHERARSLVYVFTLFRGGQRAALESYPKEKNKENKWPNGLGKLTEAGEKSMRNLGKFYRERYGPFLSSDPSEVEARSCPEPRCYDSARFVIEGMYSDTRRKSVKIKKTAKGKDKYTYLCEDLMPMLQYRIDGMGGDDVGENGFSTAMEFLNYLSEKTGVPNHNTVKLFTTLDAVMSQYRAEKLMPRWFKVKEMSFVRFEDHLFALIATVMEGNMGRAIIKEVADNITSRFSKQRSSATSSVDGATAKSTGRRSYPKFTLFAYHSTNVGAFVHYFVRDFDERPPYGATVFLEVHERGKSHVIEIFYSYRNGSHYEVKPIEMKRCPQPCTVEKFADMVRLITPVSSTNCKRPKIKKVKRKKVKSAGARSRAEKGSSL